MMKTNHGGKAEMKGLYAIFKHVNGILILIP